MSLLPATLSSPLGRAADAVARMRLRTKVMVLLCAGLVALPLALLVSREHLAPAQLDNLLAMLVAAGLILLLPVSTALAHLLALRRVDALNRLCLRMKEGDLSPFAAPPTETEEGDGLQALEYNLFWMGHVIRSRQSDLRQAMLRLERAHEDAAQSLDYASLIQTAFLPPRDTLRGLFAEHFLIWEQRDVVGGDSYWLKRTPGGHFFAVIDCTGHGVPGAFMSLIVHSLFERQDAAALEGDPGALLSAMNREIKNALAQHTRQASSDDGMDCVVCHVDDQRTRLVVAGARNSLFLVPPEGEPREIRTDRCGVGFVRTPEDFAFANTTVPLEPGTRFYACTDGLADQVGENGLPLGRRRVKEFLAAHRALPMDRQRRELAALARMHAGAEPRRDDMTVLGFTFTHQDTQ